MKKNKIQVIGGGEREEEENVDTTKKSKKGGLGQKKKRRADEDLEDMMEVEYNEKTLTKKFEQKMDISDKSDEESEEEIVSESDPEEEVLIDEGHDDDSEEYIDNEDEKMNDDGEENSNTKNVKVNIWDEKSKMKENTDLEFDNEAYEMLHRAKVEWPCMTVDFLIPQNFSAPINNFYDKSLSNQSVNDAYPYTCYMVAGGQTTTQNGFLYYMKWFNMQQTKYDDDPDKGADSDEEEAEDPFLKFEKIQVKGNINKIKAMKNSYLTAYWSDTPSIEIVDMRELITELEEKSVSKYDKNKEKENKNKKRKLNTQNITLKTFSRGMEGFGLEWSPLLPGVLAAGGHDKKIEIYIPTDESCTDWVVNSHNANNQLGILKGHKAAIEDLIWSPAQPHVLASCSIDKSIRFWDLRLDKSNPPIIIEKAHESDVNCISWNHFCDFMIASGGDDSAFKVWDIRYLSNGPISNIQWHKGPITALSWDPFEDSQLAVSSEDNRLSIWDFAVEPDDTHLFDATNQEIPQQLIFLHQGQENIKDIKFHPQYKNFIVSTAENGINVFKPAFDDNDSVASDDGEMYVDN